MGVATASLSMTLLATLAGDPAHVLYLHTSGLTLTVAPKRGVDCSGRSDPLCGMSDAALNTTWLPTGATDRVTVPALRTEDFGDEPDLVRQALQQQVAALFSGINLEVVLERPEADIEYSMVIVGGRPSDIGIQANVAGIAPLDCEDQNHRDIAFTFSEDINTITDVARVTAQEAAHSYGLEHEREPIFVMHPDPRQAIAGFSHGCTAIDPAQEVSNPDGIKCLHLCESLAHQSSFPELLQRFGPAKRSIPDFEAPLVDVSQPVSGAHFPASPATFRIDLFASDNIGLKRSWLSVNGGTAMEDPTYPYGFNAHAWDDGAYQLEVVVEDSAGNRGHASQTLYIGTQSDPIQWPALGPESLSPQLEDQTGDPVACTDDRQCAASTHCIDGVCLQADSLSCQVVGSPGYGGPLSLLCLLSLGGTVRRRRGQSSE